VSFYRSGEDSAFERHRSRLRPLKAWYGPKLHKIYPKVKTLRKFAGKPSNLATVENLMTITQF